MGLTSLPPIWTMSLNILFFLEITPKEVGYRIWQQSERLRSQSYCHIGSNRAVFAENIRKQAPKFSSRVRAYIFVYAPVSQPGPNLPAQPQLPVQPDLNCQLGPRLLLYSCSWCLSVCLCGVLGQRTFSKSTTYRLQIIKPLQQTSTHSFLTVQYSCQGDICPHNICPGDNCPLIAISQLLLTRF